MTPLNGAKPSTKVCREAACIELKVYVLDNGLGRKQYYCGITDKVPGNMYKCPLEVIE